jgi:diguanylate cyclase (GGDEF)-like protein
MVRIIGCITQQHDLRLILCALLICCFACFTTVNMLWRAASHSGRGQAAWLFGAAIVFGSGVWTTHFVAMLAFISDQVIGYAIGITTLSFLTVCFGAVGAFWLAVNHARNPLGKLASGIALGSGVAAMHYIGIAAMWLHGSTSFEFSYVVASVVAAAGFSSLAVANVGALQSAQRCLVTTGWLCAAVLALHFTGMTAFRIEMAPVQAPAGLLIGSTLLATVIMAVCAVILALSLFGSLVDGHLSSRLTREAETLHHLAHHDALTGLPNRLHCNQHIAELVTTRSGADTGVAVLCLDLDRFKQVNDVFGHQGGDRVLVQVGIRLQSLVRPTDIVARIGGDEFVVLVVPPIAAAAAATLAGRIIDAMSASFQLDGQQVTIGTSVGLALAPADGVTGPDLLKNADIALYQAKKDGRGTYRFFKESMNKQLRDRQMLERDLHTGITEDQFELHYQPFLDLRTRKIVGFEALARWRHPTRGLVPPDAFIPLAEETGLIVPLGRLVLDAACREAASWDAPLTVAVNFSPVQFREDNLAEQVMDVLSRTGLAPDRLEMEVTENVLLRQTDSAVKTLNALGKLGISISLDDFGTGYSSLSYLRRFAFNKIKLDRSFIQALGEDAESAVITRAIVALGHSLRLTVIAEGVETQEQLAFLEDEGCDQVQGYLIGKPMPASSLVDLVGPRTGARGDLAEQAGSPGR